MSAINASPESFVHKALKDEQIECIHRIVCHGRDVLSVLPTGLGKSAICQIITDPHEIVLFSVCIKSTNVVFKVAKQLSEENGGGPFC